MSHYRANATAYQFRCKRTKVECWGGIVGQERGQALHFGMAAKMQGMTPTVDTASLSAKRTRKIWSELDYQPSFLIKHS